jgi:excisionase family DNA binding protein
VTSPDNDVEARHALRTLSPQTPVFEGLEPMKGNAMVDDDELLTPAEVGRIFRVNPKTVTRWAITGKIKAVRTLGGHRRFYRSEIDRAIKEAIDADEREDF